jgi:hypothetical protein
MFFRVGRVVSQRAGEVALVASAVHADGLHCRSSVPQGVPQTRGNHSSPALPVEGEGADPI